MTTGPQPGFGSKTLDLRNAAAAFWLEQSPSGELVANMQVNKISRLEFARILRVLAFEIEQQEKEATP